MSESTGLKAKLKVGMEIHVELATRSKMWTAAPNVAHPDFFDSEPNTLLSPVVIGMPGTLPVMNKEAVEMSIKVGMALDCEIAKKCKWDRKSYYYPDLPKNYQISQYDQPLVGEGEMEIPLTDDPNGPTKTIRITRAHLEEDAGKLAHEGPGGAPIDHSIVDLNRAGTPLLEIVTEPDFSSADEAVTFGQMLRDICRHLGVSEGIMQKGHMRFEPNINVEIEKDGKVYKTPIVEIKNLNSFRAVHGAITHEYDRQIEEWLETGVVMGARAKTTRGWDDVKGVTLLQRTKEDADEYRYFPDPDLVDLIVEDEWLAEIGKGVTELPLKKLQRYMGEYKLNEKDARALVDEPATTRYYEKTLELGMDPKRAATMLLNYGLKRANEAGCRIDEIGITAEQVAGIEALLKDDKIGSSAADELFGYCCESDDTAEKLADKHGLVQVSDTGALEGFVDEVLANDRNAKIVADIEGGKDAAVGALIGQIMKLSKGQANPKMIREIIIKKVRG
ncbi:Asp-tRNA(Asn)/Glu-tRNA(Gln) amidotransferase subunit GatB [Planctomycetota bacterium]|nr:Asp-tRNA(Asn)/Glu-tRNA(Gln) amidotransferase subunit GatB [Planctomycetota bacterium]